MDFRRAVLFGFLGLTAGGVAAACVKNNEPPTFERLAAGFDEQVDELDREWDGTAPPIERSASREETDLRALTAEIEEGLEELERRLDRLEDAPEDERDAIERELDSAISRLQRSIDEVRRDLG